MRSVSALGALVRWQNTLIAFAGVLLGAWWSRGNISVHVLAAALAAVFFTAAANSWNDVADIDIDRIAHPERPLPSERLTTSAARWVASISAALAVILSFIARPQLGALSVAVLVTMRLYSPHIKRLGLPGNLVVALLSSLPFLYGAWAAGRARAGLILVAIAAPLQLAREIAKDLDDVGGDRGFRHTLPIRIGARGARTAMVLAVLLFVAAVLPLALRLPPFAAALLPALFLCAFAVRRALIGRAGSSRLFKAAMVCAMLAFAVARA